MVTPKKCTIGILTGGGDVPGLNPCIKQLVLRAAGLGMQVVGIRKGWQGLLAYHDGQEAGEYVQVLEPAGVRTIDRSGGTVLHTSRTNPQAVSFQDAPEFLKARYDDKTKKQDFTEQVLANLNRLGIDALIAIGGDDTLSYALRLHQEGFPVVAIPKTMDNDVNGTDYCIGFSTAVTRSVGFIHALRTSAGSHERIAVVELFGRYCGETSLISGYLAGADRTIISEVPFDIQRLAELLAQDRRQNPSRYAIMTISEGAVMRGGEMVLSGQADAFGHRKLGGVGALTAEAVKKLTGVGIIFQPLFYLMRSGALNYATLAVELVQEGRTGRMVALCNGCYRAVDIHVVTGGAKRVDVQALYDAESYRPNIQSVSDKPMFLY